MRSDPSYLYPEELADDGIGEKIRLIIPVGFPIIPAGLRGRGYGRQNQADYTRWSSRARVWETKSSRLYPLVFADEGMGDKIRLIIPAGLRGRGYGRQNQVDYTRWLSDQRGLDRASVKISPVATGPAGLSKRFYQNKPCRYQTSGA